MKWITTLLAAAVLGAVAAPSAGSDAVAGGLETCELNDDGGYTVNQNEPLPVPEPGVLGNDVTVSCRGSIQVLGEPRNGSVQLNSDGSFTYTPNPGFAGSDDFTYTFFLGGELTGPEAAEVTIDVVATCQGDAVDDVYEVAQGEPLNIAAPGVLANDKHCGYIAANLFSPLHGDGAVAIDGALRYTPDPGFVGVDTIGYKLLTEQGGHDVDEATVTITVTEPPCEPGAADDTYEVHMDTPLNVEAPGLLANDDACDLVAGVLTPPSFGALELNGDGSFVYTPPSNSVGETTFEYYLFHPDSPDEAFAAGRVTLTITEATGATAPADTTAASTAPSATTNTSASEQPPADAEPPAPTPASTEAAPTSTEPPAPADTQPPTSAAPSSSTVPTASRPTAPADAGSIQVGQAPPPATGHAQVIAQQVIDIDGGAQHWAIGGGVLEPGAPPTTTSDGILFVIGTGGTLVAVDGDGEPAGLLDVGEAVPIATGGNLALSAVGEQPAAYLTVQLLDGEPAGNPTDVGEPFTVSGSAHDVDLIRDVLAPGEQATIRGAPVAPTLVVVTVGSVELTAGDADPVALVHGDAQAVAGDVHVTNTGDTPATFVAVVVGPSIERT